LGIDREKHIFECPDNNLIAQAIQKQKTDRESKFRAPVPLYKNSIDDQDKNNDDEDWGNH
jgi:hypothetical protein